MRENFDYVTMDNYSADMAELSQTAVNAIEYLVKERDDLKRLVWSLVKAAGGKVEVYDDLLWRPRERKLTTWRSDANMSYVYLAE